METIEQAEANAELAWIGNEFYWTHENWVVLSGMKIRITRQWPHKFTANGNPPFDFYGVTEDNPTCEIAVYKHELTSI